jgi:16S rRNA processing protein RimM
MTKIKALKKTDWITVGEITGAHGIRGQVKVASLTDFAEQRFAIGSELYIERLQKKMKITESQIHKGLYLLKLDGINDRDLAQALLHSYVQIDINDLAELPEGQYYHFQLIGMQVYEDDTLLGEIIDVRPTGANDVYYIKTPDGSHGGEILLPALKDVVLDVDLSMRKMQVKVPAGLL